MNTCKCGRPRYTGGDHARWLNELDRFVRDGGERLEFNPDWAKAICWSIHEVACQMKPVAKG